MGAKPPTAGREKKPFVKHEGRPNNQHGKGNNNNRRDNTLRTEKFLGADPDLRENVFEAKRNRSEQVVDFTTVVNIIKAQVGTECDPFVLESLEKEVESIPEEPTAVAKEDGSMIKIEEMKFKSKYDKYLNRIHKVEMQLKQTYSKYYGQIDEEMKGTLTKDQEFEKAHQEKDVLTPRKLFKNINFNYRRSEEPIKTLCGGPIRTSLTSNNRKWTSPHTSKSSRL